MEHVLEVIRILDFVGKSKKNTAIFFIFSSVTLFFIHIDVVHEIALVASISSLIWLIISLIASLISKIFIYFQAKNKVKKNDREMLLQERDEKNKKLAKRKNDFNNSFQDTFDTLKENLMGNHKEVRDTFTEIIANNNNWTEIEMSLGEEQLNLPIYLDIPVFKQKVDAALDYKIDDDLYIGVKAIMYWYKSGEWEDGFEEIFSSEQIDRLASTLAYTSDQQQFLFLKDYVNHFGLQLSKNYELTL